MFDYLIVNGQKVPESEFYKALTISEARRFAYDPQLELFPDPKIEELRTLLRKQFDSGKTIEVVRKQFDSGKTINIIVLKE